MSRSTAPVPGGELEYAVLRALWDLRKASAREIHELVGKRDGLVYTTTTKVLDRLHEKGLVSRRRMGKAFVYAARVKRADVERRRARGMLKRLFGGDPEPALASLVDAVEAIDPDLLRQLARAVEARRRSRRGS